MLSLPKKTMIGGAIGNALDMYDYGIWGLFSVYLSKEFLPPNANFSDIFFLFLLTYIFRPLGSVLGGMLADQIGRKKILTLSIFFMGAGTGIVGLLPSYERIGVISVFLLLLIRLIQVVSVGSEYITSVALLIESCNKNQRGYFASWTAFGVNAGMLSSSLMGALIFYLIDIKLIPDWGWRIAFILAFVTMLVAYWIRNSLPESLEFIIQNARKEKRSFTEIVQETLMILKTRPFDALLVFSLVCFGVSTTVLIFISSPLFMTAAHHINNAQSFLINSVSLSLVTLLIPLFGFISDRLGREKLILIGSMSLSLLSLSYFNLLPSGSFYHVLLAHSVMAIPCALIFALTPVLITEIFPLSIRCSVTNLIYSLAACLGGGITPLIAFKLEHYAHYLPGIVLILLGGINMFLITIYMKRKNDLSPKLVLVN